jgi:hypothetical protein
MNRFSTSYRRSHELVPIFILVAAILVCIAMAALVAVLAPG